MTKLIILTLFLITFEFTNSKSIILKVEKSYDSGKTFINYNNHKSIKDNKIIEIPKSQLLYDKNKDVYFNSNDGGKTWYKKEMKIINSLTISSDLQFIEFLPKDNNNLKIFNINGNSVESELNELKNGIYFIQFNHKKKSYFYKIMVLK